MRRALILLLTLCAGCAHNHGALHGGACQGTAHLSLKDLERDAFIYDGKTVYQLGSGPGVLLLHEIYGLSPETLCLARRLADRGYKVFLPRLFDGGGNLGVARMCAGRDFNCVSRHPSRVIGWLHGLVRQLLPRTSNRKLGIIGMCLTGAFPLALVKEEGVRVAVVAQPSLPFNLTPGRRWELGIGDDALKEAVDAVRDRHVHLLALRFHADRISAEEKLATLKHAFGDRLDTMELLPPPGRHEHATLTYSFRPEAFERVVKTLDAELKP